VAKYNDGLPLYRQAGIWQRDGVNIDPSTLCFWVGQTVWWLTPLYQLLCTTTLSSPKLFCDDTHLPVLAKGKTHKGALFGYARDDRPWNGPLPPAVVYVYTDGRKNDSPLPQLGNFSGVLQVDGWRGFKALASSRKADEIILAFCWSHGRRGFYEVFESTQSPIAAEVLQRIASLYQIEDTIRGQPPDERRQVRQEQSKPIVEALKTYLETQLDRVSGKSPLAKAIRYLLNHWKGLIVFLDDGRVEIDNNTIERLHRLIATVRKNALFAGAESGANAWAILVSLIQSARLNGHDPFAYLKDVLERIVSGRTKANQLETLLPWNWKPAPAL
jgi:transposase